jgi:hypothetical protein
MAINSIFRHPAEDYNAKVFVGDFEQAQWHAILSKFADVKITWCLFHFSRIIEKAISRHGGSWVA